MEKILSVIIPSYNSQQFLDKIIPSFLDPEVIAYLDLIIVNDGSTDDTAAVAQGYCDQYPGSVRLINQVNKGHGGALNTGCAAAVGKYLRVVDADDWVETRNLKPFLDFLKHCESDVVLSDYDTVDISTGEIKRRHMAEGTAGKIFTLEELMRDRVNNEQLLALHGITYRRDFYREHAIALSEHVFYEDMEYTTIPCCYARTLAASGILIYHYRIGDVQQSVSDVNQLKRISHMETVLERLIREYGRIADVLDPGQKRFYCVKTRALLLRYLTTILLLEPDRKKGRDQARETLEKVRSGIPQAFEMAKRQYLVFLSLNVLHVSKKTWDGILQSDMYKKLRRKRY